MGPWKGFPQRTVLVILPEDEEQLREQECTEESGFDPVELWLSARVMTYSAITMQGLTKKLISYLGNNIGTRGSGRREPFPAR